MKGWLAILLATVVLGACSAAPVGRSPEPGATGPASTTSGPSARPTARPTTAPPATPKPFELLGALPTKPLDAATAARLQGVLDSRVASGSPDAIAAVITRDGTWAGAAGVDGPDNRKATAADEFNIASVSKTIVAALLVHLADKGSLDLDAPLANYLQGIAVDANQATIREALAMRSGIGDTAAEVLDRAAADCSHPWSQAEVVAAIPQPFGPAGTTYQYSNPTFKLLGYAAEQATTTSLATAIAEGVVDPADQGRLLLQGTERKPPKPWALPLAGHTGTLPLTSFGVGYVLPCLSLETLALGGSAMASDAPTLARWAWRLFAGEVVTPDGLRQMTTTDPEGHGLGIDRLTGYGTDLAFGHGGTQSGYAAFLSILPERGIVAVLFINDGNANVEDYIHELF